MEQTIIKNIILILHKHISEVEYLFGKLGWLLYYESEDFICIQRKLNGECYVSFDNEIYQPDTETEKLISELLNFVRDRIQDKKQDKLKNILERTNELLKENNVIDTN